MARRLEYVGGGRMRDAVTRDLISAKTVVEDFNAMAERLEMIEAAGYLRNDETRREGIAPNRTQ
jgi:hypothetical protein